MKPRDAWHYLRTGNTAAGLKTLKQNYDKDPNASHIMELGCAYLWVQQYDNAWEHFRKAIERYPQSMSNFYGMAGVARWCLHDSSAAVRLWRDGLRVDYADTLGLGIQLPLLLLVASILRPGSFEKHTALKLLEEKSGDDRVSDWPGPLALWALGKINRSELKIDPQPSASWALRSGGNANELETLDRQWLTSFYGSVLSYRVENEVAFKTEMQKLADTSAPSWSNHDFFLARMWSEEFFLARHEAVANSTHQS